MIIDEPTVLIPVKFSKASRVLAYMASMDSIPDTEEVVAPSGETDKANLSVTQKLKESAVEWSLPMLYKLEKKIAKNDTALRILDFCSLSPQEYVSFSQVMADSNLTPAQGR